MKTGTTKWGRGTLHAAGATALLGFAVASCQAPRAQPTGPSTDPAVGEYVTVSVNGTPVPGSVVNNQGVKLEFLEGSFVIRADGTCSSRSVFVVPSGEEMVREVDATWSRSGDVLTMQWEGAGTTTATVKEDALTMDNVGMILVYRRVSR